MSFLKDIRKDLLRLRGSAEIKKSIIYVGASSLAYGIVFLQNFLFAFIFSLDFFGKVTLLISLFSTLYVLFTFGLNTVTLRFYFDKKYEHNKRKFISHLFVCWIGTGLAIVPILFFLGYFCLSIKHFLSIDFRLEFLPVVIGAFLYSSTEIFPNFFIVQEKPLHYAASLVIIRGTIFLILLTTFYLFGESTVYIAMAFLVSGLILSVISIIVFGVFPLESLEKSMVKEILVFSFPLMIYALGGIGYSHGYRLIVSNWLDLKNQAIFSFTNQLSQIYYLTAASILTGFYPKAYRALENNNGNPGAISFYLKTIIYLGVILGVAFLPIAYFFLYYFKGGEFLLGIQILPILLVGQFILLIYGYNYMLCTYYKRTKLLTYSMLAGVISSLALAFLLVKSGDLQGAAFPIAGGLLIQFILSYLFTRRTIQSAHGHDQSLG